MRSRKQGVLATNSSHRSGYPYASVAPYSVDAQGRPVLLMSGMAVHSKNLLADPRGALLVSEGRGADAAMAQGRVNLIGDVRPVPEAEASELRSRYLRDHPEAEAWAGFGDFRLYRMEIVEVYFVAGFGRMGWIKAAEYTREP